MLYDQNKIIFVHIPKNAGTSISKCLSKYIRTTHHNADFDSIIKNNIDQLLIIRNPIDRFCSSVSHTMNFESDIETLHHNAKHDHKKKVFLAQILRQNNFTTPSQWVCAMQNPKHKYHQYIYHIIFGPRHDKDLDMVNNKHLPLVWHFAHQYFWIRQPKYIILYDNLLTEFNIFCSYHLNNKQISLEHYHRSNNINNLTPENIQYLKSIYYKDMHIYNFCKNDCGTDKRIINGLTEYDTQYC
jgi:hypothetical protein